MCKDFSVQWLIYYCYIFNSYSSSSCWGDNVTHNAEFVFPVPTSFVVLVLLHWFTMSRNIFFTELVSSKPLTPQISLALRFHFFVSFFAFRMRFLTFGLWSGTSIKTANYFTWWLCEEKIPLNKPQPHKNSPDIWNSRIWLDEVKSNQAVGSQRGLIIKVIIFF